MPSVRAIAGNHQASAALLVIGMSALNEGERTMKTLSLRKQEDRRNEDATRKLIQLALRLSDAVLAGMHPDIIRALAEHIPEQLAKVRQS